MYSFSDKRSDNIKFNVSPLLTKVEAKYTFGSEIIKTLNSFNNKKNKISQQQYLDFNNSSNHISTTKAPKSAKRNINIFNIYNNNNQNNINKYNFKSSLINDILKDDSNKKKSYIKFDNDIIRKSNKYNNKYQLRNNKTTSYINSNKPNNLNINISHNNKSNYYIKNSKNLFNKQINERNKIDIQKLKTEIIKQNNN